MFCEMIAVHLKNMNKGAAKEFLKLYIHRAVITAILHNSGLRNATFLVPQAGNSPSITGINFISPPMTPAMPHIKRTNFGFGHNINAYY